MPGDSRRQLPAEFVARAQALAAGAAPVATRDAATVVLLRDGSAGTGVEAYLLRRVSTMAFAAGMHVFPGGGVDAADADPRVAGGTGWTGPTPQDWAGVLSAGVDLARALVCAAVRETFEESGVLLAGPDDAGVVTADPGTDPGWEDDRLALIAHRLSLSELLQRRGLRLRADLLRPWAHWITPEIEPKRYDTRFFVAALPPGQATRDVGGEADRTVWLRPEEALARHAEGRLAMLPPTAFTLAELGAYPDVASVLAAATARDVRPVLPRVLVTGDQAELLMPDEPGYEAAGGAV